MTWHLKRKLREIGREGDPDRAFVRALELRLRQEIGHPVWWVKWSKFAAAGGTALVLITSATGVYAYTSDDVLPDTPLYPVRLGIEQVEQTVAVTPAAQAAVVQKIQARRIKERQIMDARTKIRDERQQLQDQRQQIQDQRQQIRQERNDLQDQASKNDDEVRTGQEIRPALFRDASSTRPQVERLFQGLRTQREDASSTRESTGTFREIFIQKTR